MRTLSEHILDLVQNSVKAGATLIEVIVNEDKITDICSLKINDNGYGMDDETLKRASSPFFTSRSTRKVGLGLPLVKQNAEMTGGRFSIDSETGKGTRLTAEFGLSHFDRPPMGDIWETLYLTMLSFEKGELVYTHRTEKGEFAFSFNETREVLGDLPPTQKDIREGIIEMIRANLAEIGATK